MCIRDSHKDRQYLYGNYNLGDKGNKTKKDCCGKGQGLKGEVGPEAVSYTHLSK